MCHTPAWGIKKNLKEQFGSVWDENGYSEKWQYLLFHNTNKPIGFDCRNVCGRCLAFFRIIKGN
jgi:hypothetical protein